ncbi:MAG: VOC family protein [Steroidobacteraceae bacterium]
MHRSQFAGIIIDCRTDDLDGAARFWSTALGMPSRRMPGATEARYVRLDDPSSRVALEVQSVDHESRVHLDIETDDVEAEVRRLESLGARRVAGVHDWCVMLAPTGQRFCVVPAFSPDFERTANRWP